MPVEPRESRTRSRGRGGRNIGALVAKGLAVAIPMFGLFAAYAFLSETTYETTAQLTLKTLPGQDQSVPTPLVLLRELQDAALDQQTLTRLAAERVGKDAPAAKRDDAAHAIRKGFGIDTKDGRTYTVTFRDSDPLRAQAICNLLANRALAHATRAVGPQIKATPSERQQRISELLGFLAQHPELASVVPGQSASNTNEAVLSGLLAEKSQIEFALKRLETRSSDNPYDDPQPLQDRATLERRLADINAIVASRKKAESERGSKVKVDPAVEAELMQKFRAVNQAPAEPPPPPPKARFTATLVKAEVPDSPIQPDRPRVLLVGTLVGLAGGIIFVIGRVKVAVPRRSRAPSSARNDAPLREPEINPMIAPLPSAVAMNPPGALLLPQQTALLLPQQTTLLLPQETSSSLPEVSDAQEVVDSPATARWPLEMNAHPGASNGDVGLASDRAEPEVQRAPSWGPPRPAAPVRRIEELTPNTLERGAPPNASRDATPQEMKLPNRKVTQILGSPPSVPGARRSTRPHDGGTMPLPNTAYSFVSVPPAEPSYAPPPRPRIMVTPLPPPLGWRPEPSLRPADRQALAQEVLQAKSEACFVVGVTGPTSDPKARVAAELAMMLAQSRRVLLLEGDFQVPTLHQWMRLEMSIATGYSHQLRARVNPGSADSAFRVVECGSSLHVLAEGVLRSPGMILSREFDDSVMKLRAQYDVIVVNGPPTSASVDLQALASVTDGIVLVAHRGGVPPALRDKRSFTPVLDV